MAGATLRRRLAGTAAASGLQGAAEAASPLISKAIPVSGEKIPAIGLGTDAFNAGARADIHAELQRMPELGTLLVDTSDDYGDSEALIGDALAALGTARAAGFSPPSSPAEPAPRCSSARSSGCAARVDLLQVHNVYGVDELMPLIQE